MERARSQHLSSSIELTIVIVNWNTREYLKRCLDSVAREIAQNATPKTQVITVDNASSDGSCQMIREDYEWVHLIENRQNLGFAEANNQALGECHGRYVLLLNSDTELGAGSLSTLISGLELNAHAGAAGPLVLNPDGSWQPSYGKLPSVTSEIIGPYLFDFVLKPWGRIGHHLWADGIQEQQFVEVERVSFACTMIRQEVLQEVGLLDESYEFYSEDYDWFLRLKKAGWQTIFCPNARVMHHWGGSSTQRSDWARRQLYRSKRLYFRKHHGHWAEWVLRCGLILRFMIAFLVCGVGRNFRHTGDRCREVQMQMGQLIRDMFRDRD